ncbi:hypothetical protein Fmac_001251 [Flemingia macrophylla]|uniref:indole-3-pyruvate monooxygenase n=1 Tax=Flemingia macrophylla TaxID=520843 RepID=A0ABD1NH16_9FABA
MNQGIKRMEKATVIIVGGGPAGLGISACLSQKCVSHIILEKEECSASLWRKNAYDRVNLHLGSEFCSLPLMPHPPSAPTFLSKADFLRYIDAYIARFNINPLYSRFVESAKYDEVGRTWRVEAKNTREDKMELYVAKFLVIATGENSEAYIPDVEGLGSFEGETMHSKYYKSGSKYASQHVLVVGCGNSGMEIAYDLQHSGATSSIVIRNPVHVLTKELIHQGMRLLKNWPVDTVDTIVTVLGHEQYGDLSKYGIYRPTKGPFYLKQVTGRSPVLDVGTIAKIKEGTIKVIPSPIARIEKRKVIFKNNEEKEFDAIVFATGYRSVVNTWLKDYKYVLNDEGMPRNEFPNHWKGDCGLYCAGLSRRGLFGVKMDAEAIADDINQTLKLH